MKLFDSTKIPLLSKALDVYALRQKVISSNIANITTEGYHSQRVSFEEEMSGALGGSVVRPEATEPGHIGSLTDASGLPEPAVLPVTAEHTLHEDPKASGINDVDIDNEMAELAKNQIRFRFASRLLAATFKSIDDSIRGSA